MITFIRWILIKHKEIRWKLAFYSFLEQQVKELLEDPEALSEKLMPYLGGIIRAQASMERETENSN